MMEIPDGSVDCIWTDPPYFLDRRDHRYTFNYAAMRMDNEGRQMKNVWRIPAIGRAERVHGKHPTQKPVTLIDRCLRASTRPGKRVLDPFAGSASAGIAALQLGRTFPAASVGLSISRYGA